jgi:hypothetical protein
MLTGFVCGKRASPQAQIRSCTRAASVGDSEQTVVALMGEPDERDWCYPLPTNGDSAEQKRFHEECVVEYTYVTFLENYGVSLDKNNRVSGKWKSVSP